MFSHRRLKVRGPKINIPEEPYEHLSLVTDYVYYISVVEQKHAYRKQRNQSLKGRLELMKGIVVVVLS